MRELAILLTIIFLSQNCFCQKDANYIKEARPKNGINANLFGNGALCSIQYDRIFQLEKRSFIICSIALGYNEELEFCFFGNCNKPRQFLILPIRTTLNFGGEKHTAEIGIGTSILFGNNEQPLVFYPILGYRVVPFQKMRVGFLLNFEIPIGYHSHDTGSFLLLGGYVPFIPGSIAISYWF